MRKGLIILFTLIAAGAWAQNQKPSTRAYTSVAEAMSVPMGASYKFDVIENGVISHFVTMRRSDAYLKPDSIMVIAMADSVSIAVRQAQEVQVEWFKKANESDWYNAFQRLAKYASSHSGTVVSLNPKVYNIDTFKAGTPKFITNIVTKDSLIADTSGATTDSIITKVIDTVLTLSNSYIPNNITDIVWLDPQNLTIKGNGATISVKGNFDRRWTHSASGGAVHQSAYSTVCPFAIAFGKNVTIENLTIDGNNDETTESTPVNEGIAYGIWFRGTDFPAVKSCYIHNIQTDGLYIEGTGAGSPGPNGGKIFHASTNAVVEDVDIEYCGRQAFTIGALNGLHAKNSHFDKTADTAGLGKQAFAMRGYAPQKGLDIEPIYEYSHSTLIRTDLPTSDITFENCTFKDNVGGSIAMSHPYTVRGISFIKCTLDNSKYNRLYNVICTVPDVTFDNCKINTGTGAMYITRDNGAEQRFTLKNSVLISGGTGFIVGAAAQYGAYIQNNWIIGNHTASFTGYFPTISSNAVFTNNHIVLDSALYLGTGQKLAAQIYTSTAEGNTWISQMDTTGSRPIYNIIYTYPKTIRGEVYTAKQAVRPYGGWDVANSDYTASTVGMGAVQVANAGLGKPEVKIYWLSTLPTKGIFKAGDVIWMTNPLAAGYNLYRCTVGGDFITTTPTFVPVGAITSTGATVYHTPLIAVGSDVYIGQNIDSVGVNKYSYAPLPPGGYYFTKAVNDTGIVAFKSPLAFNNTGEIVIKGSMYMRGKGNADFTVSSLTQGNHTFVNSALTITGDSSFQTTKVRWLKDANNDVYLAFFDTTSVLINKTFVHLESVTLTGSTQSYLANSALAWTPMVLKSLSGYTATTPTVTPLFLASTTGESMVIQRNVGGTIGEMRFGGSNGRTISAYQNGAQYNLDLTGAVISMHGTLGVDAQKQIWFTDYTGANTGYAKIAASSTGTFDFAVNSILAQSFTNTGRALYGAPINPKAYTVATLPTGNQGDVAVVTDALNPANGATLAGGGSVKVIAFYNGTNWTAVGATTSSSARALTVSAATTLTLAYSVDYVYTGTVDGTYTLPAINSNTGSAYTIRIFNKSTHNLYINTNAGGSDIYGSVSGGTPSLVLAPGASANLLPDGTSFDDIK